MQEPARLPENKYASSSPLLSLNFTLTNNIKRFVVSASERSWLNMCECFLGNYLIYAGEARLGNNWGGVHAAAVQVSGYLSSTACRFGPATRKHAVTNAESVEGELVGGMLTLACLIFADCKATMGR
jgi:hypothetical protein